MRSPSIRTFVVYVGLATLAQGCQRYRRALNATMLMPQYFLLRKLDPLLTYLGIQASLPTSCDTCLYRRGRLGVAPGDLQLSRKFGNAHSALALRDIWRSPLARQLLAGGARVKIVNLSEGFDKYLCLINFRFSFPHFD